MGIAYRRNKRIPHIFLRKNLHPKSAEGVPTKMELLQHSAVLERIQKPLPDSFLLVSLDLNQIVRQIQFTQTPHTELDHSRQFGQ